VRTLTKKKGFTLIELLIIIAIVGILAGIAIPRYLNMVRQATDGTAKSVLGALRTQNSLIFSQRVVRGTTATYTMGFIAANVAAIKGISWTAAGTRFTMTVRGNTYTFTLTPTPRPPITYGTITAGTGTFATW
jgi:prepilin-type N-terminal cleavage/methylation domain-containing protein